MDCIILQLKSTDQICLFHFTKDRDGSCPGGAGYQQSLMHPEYSDNNKNNRCDAFAGSENQFVMYPLLCNPRSQFPMRYWQTRITVLGLPERM